MSFEWLQIRITEELERRQREQQTLERLPRALQEVHTGLAQCIETYRRTFGPSSAEIRREADRISISVSDQRDLNARRRTTIEISLVPELPGFRVELAEGPWLVEMGMLEGEKLFYKDQERNQYLSLADLTRRILDRALCPKLKE
jgi:hypothetical protein